MHRIALQHATDWAGFTRSARWAVHAGLPKELHAEMVQRFGFHWLDQYGSTEGGMVTCLAGLQGIPQHLYEAAEIDGANYWQRFWNVTVPMMSPVLFFNLVIGLIGALQTFAQGYLMTKGGGGPQNATLFYGLYIYRSAFRDFKMGYASALALVLFTIVLILSLFVFRYLGRMVYYEEPR